MLLLLERQPVGGRDALRPARTGLEPRLNRDPQLRIATQAKREAHVPEPDVVAALTALASSYDDEGRGFELREVGGGWRFFTRDERA